MLAVFVLAAALATAGYAFTASNTVPATSAGEGANTISGYTVSNVAYVLNASDPTKIDRMTFSLDAAAGTVKARVVSGGTYQDCSTTNAPTNTAWSCDWAAASEPTVLSADQLSVIAVQ
jgi:hypothetical protein